MAQSSLEGEFAGTKQVDAAYALDEQKLTHYLAGVIDGFAGPVSQRQFKGGQSNPTYLLETPTRNYVLRRKPPGKLLPSAHAVDREYRVISALYPLDFPVPQPFHLCEDDAVRSRHRRCRIALRDQFWLTGTIDAARPRMYRRARRIFRVEEARSLAEPIGEALWAIAKCHTGAGPAFDIDSPDIRVASVVDLDEDAARIG